MEVVEIKVVTRVGGRTAVEGEAAAEVKLGPGIDVIEVEAATGTGAVKVEAATMGVSGTAIEVEDVSETRAADAVLLAKGLFI